MGHTLLPHTMDMAKKLFDIMSSPIPAHKGMETLSPYIIDDTLSDMIEMTHKKNWMNDVRPAVALTLEEHVNWNDVYDPSSYHPTWDFGVKEFIQKNIHKYQHHNLILLIGEDPLKSHRPLFELIGEFIEPSLPPSSFKSRIKTKKSDDTTGVTIIKDLQTNQIYRHDHIFGIIQKACEKSRRELDKKYFNGTEQTPENTTLSIPFGKNIYTFIREFLGLSQTQLAQKSNVSRRTIGRIEAGGDISKTNLSRLQNFLSTELASRHIDFDWLSVIQD